MEIEGATDDVGHSRAGVKNERDDYLRRNVNVTVDEREEVMVEACERAGGWRYKGTKI